MVTPFISSRQAADVTKAFHRMDATFRLWWSDPFVVWRLGRPAMTWDAGTADEGWQPVTQPDGVPTVGRLMEGGAAGIGDEALSNVITNLTPFRIRMDKQADITDDDMLVVNGRAFHVQTVVRTDADSDSMWVDLMERSGDDVPEEVTP